MSDIRMSVKDIQTNPYHYLYSQVELVYQKPLIGLGAFFVLGFGIGMAVGITRSNQWRIIRQGIIPTGLLSHMLWATIAGGGMGFAYSYILYDRKGSKLRRVAKDKI